jgi:ferredoxin
MPQLKDKNKPSGPVNIGKYKIWVDRNLCIGAAVCVAVASKTFVLDKENKAVILETADSELVSNLIDAAKGCPVSAIFIEDEKGNRIFPK